MTSRAQTFHDLVVGAILGPLAEHLVGAVRVRSGERVLDVACGTGAATRPAAEAAGATGCVTGVDRDGEILAVARRVAPGPGAPIAWRQADACALPLRDEEFDVVLCAQGLQFFPDRVRALREMRRVLMPGGRLALAAWASAAQNPYFHALRQALGPHIDVETLAALKTPFALADAAGLRRLLVEAGLADPTIDTLRVPLALPAMEGFVPRHMTAMSVADRLAGLSGDVVHGVVASVRAALQPHVEGDGFRVPFTTHVALARRQR